MKNQGISLITLIITIIVIIILAAIVIFTGLRTPDSAQFSAFTNDVDTVYTAMIDKFADLKVEHAVKGDYRTNEQIYIELARKVNTTDNSDPGQYARMNVDSDPDVGEGKVSTHVTTGDSANQTRCQKILVDSNSSGKNAGLGITLPKVRENRDKWYVTDDGRIFNATGFTYNDNTYFNASYFAKGVKDTAADENRAKKICAQMHSTTPIDGETNAFIVKID